MPHGKVAVNYKKITDMRMEIKNDDDKVKTLLMFFIQRGTPHPS